jgi:flagellar biosynthetic protein FliR
VDAKRHPRLHATNLPVNPYPCGLNSEMITLTSGQLNLWIASFIWPLARILGVFALAPIFGNQAVPRTIKVALGGILALVVAPTLPPMPAFDAVSMNGMLILGQQVLIGTAIGFTMRLIFAGIELAGELIGLTMGLGFASFYDPLTQGRSSSISQLLAFLATMAFLAANFHLSLIAALFESFHFMPIGGTTAGIGSSSQIFMWGGHIFASALKLSLPILGALLATNAALGILTKAAPQLNIFGIGFPITISVGLLMTGLMLPYLAGPIVHEFDVGIQNISRISAPATLPITSSQ